MPLEYEKLMKLRLNSNIFFYEEGDSKYNLKDIFAVNGGTPIVLDFGTWDSTNGMRLKKSLNRWERRTDLMGAEFVNAQWHNKGWAELIYDDNGTIVGSWGIFQEMLFYMTDQLNLTMVTKDVNKEEINGTSILKFQETEKLMPCEIMLKLHLADVCSGGVPIKGPWIGVNDTQDLTIAIQRQPNTLIAGLPKGNAPGMPFSAVMSFTSVT